jgi:beta-lysine N6-acetyltransferase
MSAYPAPADPTPRSHPIQIEAGADLVVEATDDPYSDRLRCDHPGGEVDGEALAGALRAEATRLGRGRVVVLAPRPVAEGLADAGFEEEATMPGFYAGNDDCSVLRLVINGARAELANPVEVAGVDGLLALEPAGRGHAPVETSRAEPEDAADIAALIDATFDEYPTPSGVTDYIERAIVEGTPFRLVHADGALVACASADLVPDARTAELTDCATRPSHRGRGYMQAILGDLMDDLRELDYPTAFTLARARIPGVNLAFQRLGFELRGRMTRSCRIGRGLEDMNVWSRSLGAA